MSDPSRLEVLKEFVMIAARGILRPLAGSVLLLVVMTPALAIARGTHYYLRNVSSVTDPAVLSIGPPAAGIIGWVVLAFGAVFTWGAWEEAKERAADPD